MLETFKCIWEFLKYNVSCDFIQLIIIIGGLFVAIRQYKISLFSQKFENAQTLVKSFYDSLEDEDIKAFKDIIMLRGESAGGDNAGHYMDENGQLKDFGDYFAEGAPDNRALERIVDSLERVCYFAKDNNNINAKFFYSELGQFINISYEILAAIPFSFENIEYCFNELNKKYTDIPIKTIGHIE